MTLLGLLKDHLMRPTPVDSIALGVTAGLLMHHCFFIHGEWHVQTPAIFIYHILAFTCLFIADAGSNLNYFPILHPLLLCVGYLVALFSSIVIYRLFFHRLTIAGFRGPKIASVTKIWHMWKCRSSKNHLVLDELHQKYGDFVRTGPSEITVFHPDVFMTIDGPKSQCIKAEWYDILHPNMALVTSRDKLRHRTRRSQWNKGFSAKAITQYEDKILKYIDQLEKCVDDDVSAKRVSNVTNLFYWFGFDAMGDFVFNKSFNMLHDQNWHHIIVLLQRALSLLGPLSSVPWLVQLAFKLSPRISVLGDWFTMVGWCEKQMIERIKVPEDKLREPDVAHYLIEDAKQNNYQGESWRMLNGDSLLAIVAGSEPTVAVLVGIFCELARNPEHAERIYRETKDLDLRDPHSLSKSTHLEAVISEGLRLYPALPTGGNRKTLEHGVTIGGKYIPPFTTIVAPRFTIQRREDCFERGREFIPERWSEKPELILNKAAYAPFGTGHHSCLGRFLATDDMRLVTARLVRKYHLRFPEGDDGRRVSRDLKDQFTANPGKLYLIFEAREGGVDKC